PTQGGQRRAHVALGRRKSAWACVALCPPSRVPLWITGTSLPLPAAGPCCPILKGPANQQGRLYAVSAPIPRRAARAPSGLGGGGAARAAQKSGARMEGAVALQQGANALVLRQRPEIDVVRFLLWQERHHLRFSDAHGGAQFPRGGRSAGPRTRAAGFQGLAGG